MRNDSNTMYTSHSGSGVQSASVSVSGNTGNPSDRGTNSKTVSISGTTAVNTGGAAITNAQRSGRNLPPYYALCYIMKL